METQNNRKPVNSWSLTTFARNHGKMKIGSFVNKETGEVFKAPYFVNPTDNSVTMISFSSKLGELSAQEIAQRQHELQVCQYEDMKTLKLCKAGILNGEDVELDL